MQSINSEYGSPYLVVCHFTFTKVVGSRLRSGRDGRWEELMSSVLNTMTEVRPLSKAPNPQPPLAAHCCVCVCVRLCVCVRVRLCVCVCV